MSTSNVNFFCGFFTGMPIVTKDNFIEVMMQVMISGIGNVTIESITITDKVAKVVTNDKNFKCVPGVKVAIAGTGNTTVDTRQEIMSVVSDGFTFDVDTPNATYTTGLSYSYTPLGWTLIKQTASQYIFQSGPSAKEPFYWVVERWYTTNQVNFYWHGYIAYSLNNALNPINRFPNQPKDYYQALPIHASTAAATISNKAHYYFYGDDAFIAMGTKYVTDVLYDSDRNMEIMSLTAWGECYNRFNGVGYALASGVALSQVTINTNSSLFSSGYSSSQLSGKYMAARYSVLGTKTQGGFPMYIDVSSNFLKRGVYTTVFSGVDKPTPDLRINSYKLEIFPMEIQDSKFINYCDVPGFYCFEGSTYDLTAIPYITKRLHIRNKDRNTVFVKTSHNNDASQGAPIKSAIVIFDLTGPIR